MLTEPRCFTRRCKHYMGVHSRTKATESEILVCKAFPEGIPDEIAYGTNDHVKPLKDQKNTLVYEREE